ncbi:MAG: FTR1 family protein [Alphaproteobacteria bacterium]
MGVAAESGIVVLREGLEALLVIMALAAYLTRLGRADRLHALYAGALVGIVASFVAAWVFERWYGGAHDDVVEGATLLATAGLLLYVSGWLFVRQDPGAWRQYLKDQTARASMATGVWALGSIAALAVFREGAETVLFLHAIAQSHGGWSLEQGVGLLAAFIALGALFVLWRRIAAHLPLRALFLGTSIFLFAMALRFVGAGLQEFQETGWIPFDDVGLPDWAIGAGFNPSAEALGVQLAILVAAGASILAFRRRRALSAR